MKSTIIFLLALFTAFFVSAQPAVIRSPYTTNTTAADARVAVLSKSVAATNPVAVPLATRSVTATNAAEGGNIVTSNDSRALSLSGENYIGRSVGQGESPVVTGWSSHAEGADSISAGDISHAEGGNQTEANGEGSHSEGSHTKSGNGLSGDYSHAEGSGTVAAANYSHAEGGGSMTTNYSSAGGINHAEGSKTISGGYASHSQGSNTFALGDISWSGGGNASATNNYTFVWSDGFPTGSSTDQEFTVYARNGIRLLGGTIFGNGGGLTFTNSPSGTIVSNLGINSSGVTVLGVPSSGGTTANVLTTNSATMQVVSGPVTLTNANNVLSANFGTGLFYGPSNMFQIVGTNGTGGDNLLIGQENDTGTNRLVGVPASNEASFNVGIGSGVFIHNTSGGSGVAVGREALYQNTTGIANDAVGFGALYWNTTGSHNEAFGCHALSENSTGNESQAIGYRALENNKSGSGNLAVGYMALDSLLSGSYNIALGWEALFQQTNNDSNIGIGHAAMYNMIGGTLNVAIGDAALYYNVDGQKNTSVGGNSGQASKQHDNKMVFLGYRAQAATGSGTLANSGAIGYGATVGASDTLVLGGTDDDNGHIQNTVVSGSLTISNGVNVVGGIISGDGSQLTGLNTNLAVSKFVYPPGVPVSTWWDGTYFRDSNWDGTMNTYADPATRSSYTTNYATGQWEYQVLGGRGYSGDVQAKTINSRSPDNGATTTNLPFANLNFAGYVSGNFTSILTGYLKYTNSGVTIWVAGGTNANP
jgi:hypothetical protein